MQIRRGYSGSFYVVFENNMIADDWEWLFWGILRRTRACFGQYENAYKIF